METSYSYDGDDYSRISPSVYPLVLPSWMQKANVHLYLCHRKRFFLSVFAIASMRRSIDWQWHRRLCQISSSSIHFRLRVQNMRLNRRKYETIVLTSELNSKLFSRNTTGSYSRMMTSTIDWGEGTNVLEDRTICSMQIERLMSRWKETRHMGIFRHVSSCPVFEWRRSKNDCIEVVIRRFLT